MADLKMPPAQRKEWHRAQPANRLCLDWKKNLPEEIMLKTPSIAEAVLDCSQVKIKELQENRVQKGRMAAVMSARMDDACFFPATLPALARQMEAAGMSGEIFVVLNSGGSEGEAFINAVGGSYEGIPVAIGGALRNGAADESHLPGKIVADDAAITGNTGIKIVFINQEDLPANAGKIRALRDIYAYLGRLSLASAYRPEFLFAMDAETALYPHEPETGRVHTESSKGLAQLIASTQSGKRIAGAKTRLMPFNGALPDWESEIPYLAGFTNEMHGFQFPQEYAVTVERLTDRSVMLIDRVPGAWLCGGATLGDFAAMTGAMGVISTAFPSIRVEDTLFTIVMRLMGVETHIDTGTVHINRCPHRVFEDGHISTPKEYRAGIQSLKNGGDVKLTKSEELFSRYFRGNAGLKKTLGDLIYLAIEDKPELLGIIYEMGGFMGRIGPANEVLMILIRARNLIQEYSRQHPDDPLNGSSSWRGCS